MLKTISKNILSNNFILPFNKGNRFIFIYHDISDESALQYSVLYSTRIKRFEEQIEFLSKLFDWLDLDTITREEPFNNNVAALVFDDGFKSVETTALPILRKKNIPFSVFVCQGAIKYNRLWVSDLLFNTEMIKKEFGPEFAAELNSPTAFSQLEKNPEFQNKINSTIENKFMGEQIYLDEKDVLNLFKQGVTIGNHGSFHANLSVCSEENINIEIESNKLFIENIIHSKVKHYAIAFGKKEHISEKAIDYIYNSGHEFIYSSNPISFSANKKQSLIPRIGIANHSEKEIMFYINRQFVKSIDI